MDQGLEFRKEFIEAYMSGKIRPVGLHQTYGAHNLNSMTRGLKCKPSIIPMIRRELGVHFYTIYPKNKGSKPSEKRVEESFDNLCRAFGLENEPCSYEEPGIAVLTENVPRSRFYESKRASRFGIYNHRYVPVIDGLEDSIHTLVPRENIIKIVFLSNEKEVIPILEQANERYGNDIITNYLELKGRMTSARADSLRTRKAHFVNLQIGRLLLSKVKQHIIID